MAAVRSAIVVASYPRSQKTCIARSRAASRSKARGRPRVAIPASFLPLSCRCRPAVSCRGAPSTAGRGGTGRYGTPEGVAAMVAHLAGPEAAGVTGSVFTVDAGANA
ncbi:SDR family oxidoreductase [Streptomyces sp. GKU 257-1]|nr:SDR family oxidoreductase [Streptomyces sp. GKU 257-1]